MTTITVSGSSNNSNLVIHSTDATITESASAVDASAAASDVALVADNYTARAGYGICDFVVGTSPVVVACRFSLHSSYNLLSDPSKQEIAQNYYLKDGGFMQNAGTTAVGAEIVTTLSIYDADPNDSIVQLNHVYPSAYDFLYFWESYMARPLPPTSEFPTLFSYLTPAMGKPADSWLDGSYNRLKNNYIMINGLNAAQQSHAEKFLDASNTYSVMLGPECLGGNVFKFAKPLLEKPNGTQIYGTYRPEAGRYGTIDKTFSFGISGSNMTSASDLFIADVNTSLTLGPTNYEFGLQGLYTETFDPWNTALSSVFVSSGWVPPANKYASELAKSFPYV